MASMFNVILSRVLLTRVGLFTTCLRLKDKVNDPGLNWLKSPNKTIPAFGKLITTVQGLK